MLDIEEAKPKNKIEKIYFKYNIGRYISFFVGLVLFAISFNLFLLPNNLVLGGVTGISVITKYLFGIDPTLFIFISSVILLIFSFFLLSKEETLKSVLGSLLLPVFIELTTDLSIYMDISSSELLLASLFGGIIAGVGIGLVFKAGFTTGGTDILSQILYKYFHISIGKSMLVICSIIAIGGGLCFGINNLMYSLIVIYLMSFFTDKVLLGISDCKAFYIITVHDDKIRNFILKELKHGVTVIDAKGGFTKEKEKMLFCVIPTNEYFKLKEGIHSIDPKAFFVATDAYEVFGGE